MIKIKDIKILEGRRRLDNNNVLELSKSIKDIGLINPITISTDNVLIAGYHRLEACKLLGFDTIECNVLDLTDLNLKLAEIDENLIRSNLSVLERGEFLSKRKDIYESIHPETKVGGDRYKNQTEIISVCPSFAEDTANKIDKTERTIRQEVQIGNIPEDIKDMIRDLPISNVKTDLIDLAKIAKEDPQKAKDIVAKITSGEGKNIKSIMQKQRIEDIKQNSLTNNDKLQAYITKESFETWLPKQEQCDMLITDPPYSTDMEDFDNFVNSWFPLAISKVKDTGFAYIFIGAYPNEVETYLKYSHNLNLELEQILIWSYKNTHLIVPKQKYNQNYQMCLYFKGPNSPDLDIINTNESFAVQEFNAPDGRLGNRYHKWQKPDELSEQLIRHSTKEDNLVLDPFAGSGTFLVNAGKLKRIAYGCDIDEEAINICEQRGCIKSE